MSVRYEPVRGERLQRLITTWMSTDVHRMSKPPIDRRASGALSGREAAAHRRAHHAGRWVVVQGGSGKLNAFLRRLAAWRLSLARTFSVTFIRATRDRYDTNEHATKKKLKKSESLGTFLRLPVTSEHPQK